MSYDVEALHGAFARGLGIDEDVVHDDLEYNTIPEWDSVAHMQLVVEIEDAFGVMLSTDDILDMSTVARTREILEERGVEFER